MRTTEEIKGQTINQMIEKGILVQTTQDGGFKTDINMKKQNYHETELGKVPDSIKKVQLSERTENILSGQHDNDFIDPEKQPVLAKINAKIKAKQMINWAELSRTIAGDRSAITKDRIPEKHKETIELLINSIAEWILSLRS